MISVMDLETKLVKTDGAPISSTPVRFMDKSIPCEPLKFLVNLPTCLLR